MIRSLAAGFADAVTTHGVPVVVVVVLPSLLVLWSRHAGPGSAGVGAPDAVAGDD